MYARIGKRILDLLLSSIVTVVTSPLMLFICVLIRLSSPGPILYRQKRLGKDARTFIALKFRTMVDRPRHPAITAVSSNDPDVTRVGRLLRRLKLDELPQLWNVIRGDMSLVGPRPQLPIQLADFNDDAKLRLEVRPGMTGMAQTHGNTSLTWPERWYYDAYYVRNLSFGLDCRLMLRTLLVLLNGEERYVEHPPNDPSAAAGA